MIRDLVLHVGDCKTGSSSIQRALIDGAARAEGQEVCYPTKGSHNPQAAALRGQASTVHPKRSFEAARRRFAKSEAAIGVISSEHFEFVAPETLHAAVEAALGPELVAKARVIAYVRPHPEQVLSRFVQNTKMGEISGSLEAYYDTVRARPRFVYLPRFEAWRAVWGDRFTLRAMAPGHLFQGDVVQDFFHWLFGGKPFEYDPIPAQNAAPTVEDLALLRALHALHQDDPDLVNTRVGFGALMVEALAKEPRPGTKVALHRALAARIAKDFRADAEAVDAAFFDGTPLTDGLEAALERAIETPQPIHPEEVHSADALRAARISARAMITALRATLRARRALSILTER